MAKGHDYFRFKQFIVQQNLDVMRVNTDGVLLGAWVSDVVDKQILEIGTGTGVIALQLLQRGAKHVSAIDIDAQACEQALRNAEASPWAEQMTVQQISFQEYAEQADAPYELIVSNPPYYSASLHSPNARRNQMRHADTLSTEDLLLGLELCLSPEGRFAAIFPLAEGSLFIAYAAQKGLYCSKQVEVAEQPLKPPKRLLCEFQRTAVIPKKTALYIRDTNGNFSKEYRELTSPFYLNF